MVDPEYDARMEQETTDVDKTVDTTEAESDAVVDELLIEEISIDGMCGVY
jgi:mycofactocin precursor